VISFTPLPLYPWGESPGFRLDSRLVGLHRLSGRCGEVKENCCLCREPNPGHPDWRYMQSVPMNVKQGDSGGHTEDNTALCILGERTRMENLGETRFDTGNRVPLRCINLFGTSITQCMQENVEHVR
jgi:hypothetical protein